MNEQLIMKIMTKKVKLDNKICRSMNKLSKHFSEFNTTKNPFTAIYKYFIMLYYTPELMLNIYRMHQSDEYKIKIKKFYSHEKL